MAREAGLRERKKAQTRQYIADTAARLFATHGFDAVSIADVARAAEVSDQTVYNYFPGKQDLVIDRAEEFRERFRRTVAERPAATTPAAALRPLAHVEIERHRGTDLDLARGEFPTLCVSSPTIRRFALEFREQQAEAVTAAILATSPDVPPAVARAHAAALIAVFQMIGDRIGRGVLDATPAAALADELAPEVDVVLDDLDRHFRRWASHAPAPPDVRRPPPGSPPWRK